MRKILAYCLIYFFTFAFLAIILNSRVLAFVDPRNSPNNKFGIGILSPEADIEDADSLVNSNGGDWGYITLVIRRNERDPKRWQGFFDNLNKRHLIPIVRLATEVNDRGQWELPLEEDAQNWADFLGQLPWPVKNRYVQVYNEVNRADEWGGEIDPGLYAVELDKTIAALKTKSDNFFILNAPLDLALKTSRDSLDASSFFKQMELTSPGIFLKIDGLASHSYPNPAFNADPMQGGMLGISGYKWEISQISPFIKGKNLPVFITETGWARNTEGINAGLDEKAISDFYQIAFSQVWNDPVVVCVTPFLLNDSNRAFYKFSFKKNGPVDDKPFFDYYYAIQSLKKIKGEQQRENKLSDLAVEISGKAIKNLSKEITLTFKNRGNLLWVPGKNINIYTSSTVVEVKDLKWQNEEIYPGQEAIVRMTIKSGKEGVSPLFIKINNQEENLGSQLLEIETVNYFSFIIETIKNII